MSAADEPTRVEALAELTPEWDELPVAAAPEQPRGYRRRFELIYVALALVAGLGIGAFCVLVLRPEAAPTPAWSSFEPSGSDLAKTRQIAELVSKSYRLENGNQLAVALASSPTFVVPSDQGTTSVPVKAIALRPDTSTGQAEEKDVDLIDATSSYQYVLCGLGAGCAVPGGSDAARGTLLRRQAVELALYTFKYADSVDSVAVFLPAEPAADAQGSPTVVFFQRSDLAAELRKPVARTLVSTKPHAGELPADELASINRLTLPHLYGFEYQPAADGSAILVLSPRVTPG